VSVHFLALAATVAAQAPTMPVTHLEVYFGCVESKAKELTSSGESVDLVADATLTLCTSYLRNAVDDRVRKFRRESPNSSLSDSEVEEMTTGLLVKRAREFAIADVVSERANKRKNRRD
jgi:hypothetical protein